MQGCATAKERIDQIWCHTPLVRGRNLDVLGYCDGWRLPGARAAEPPLVILEGNTEVTAIAWKDRNKRETKPRPVSGGPAADYSALAVFGLGVGMSNAAARTLFNSAVRSIRDVKTTNAEWLIAASVNRRRKHHQRRDDQRGDQDSRRQRKRHISKGFHPPISFVSRRSDRPRPHRAAHRSRHRNAALGASENQAWRRPCASPPPVRPRSGRRRAQIGNAP